MIKAKKTVSKINRTISNNIAILRRLNGMSQKDIANKIGVTFQQIQKYESGIDAFSVDKLYAFAKALRTNINVLLNNNVAYNTDVDFNFILKLSKLLGKAENSNIKLKSKVINY